MLVLLFVLVVLMFVRMSQHKSSVELLSPDEPELEPPKPMPSKKQNFVPFLGRKHPDVAPWKKPKGFKIIGLIFFGRQRTVEILDCYLKRNSVSNGGFLDEVLWVANTNNTDDLKYLDKLVKTSASYRNLTLIDLGFDRIWEHAVDDKNTIYFHQNR